jgi:hypothetical protein
MHTNTPLAERQKGVLPCWLHHHLREFAHGRNVKAFVAASDLTSSNDWRNCELKLGITSEQICHQLAIPGLKDSHR